MGLNCVHFIPSGSGYRESSNLKVIYLRYEIVWAWTPILINLCYSSGISITIELILYTQVDTKIDRVIAESNQIMPKCPNTLPVDFNIKANKKQRISIFQVLLEYKVQ